MNGEGFRQEFLREYLGKVLIGLLLAIAIRNTATSLSQPTLTSGYELRLAAMAAVSGFDETAGEMRANDADTAFSFRETVHDGTLFGTEREAAEQLGAPRALGNAPACRVNDLIHCPEQYNNLQRGRLAEYQLKEAVENKLRTYHWFRAAVYLLLVIALVLQCWHLYYTLRAFYQFIPSDDFAPLYARFDKNEIRQLDGHALGSLVILAIILLGIPLASPEIGRASWLFLGIGVWSFLWLIFDLIRKGAIEKYKIGLHEDFPLVYEAYRRPAAEWGKWMWMRYDIALLITWSVVTLWFALICRGPWPFQTPTSYSQLTIRSVQEIIVLLVLVVVGWRMFLVEWEKTAPKPANGLLDHRDDTPQGVNAQT